MHRAAPSIPLLLLALLVGCAASCAPVVRVLASETPDIHAEPEVTDRVTTPATAPPRIGAPGGSGAGSRRVAPAAAQVGAQSGNETVGGLPAGGGGPLG
jgi:hypothetical protein